MAKKLLDQMRDALRLFHEDDLLAGAGEVYLPDALSTKYPNAARDFIWQYLFPAAKRSPDPRSGQERRSKSRDFQIPSICCASSSKPVSRLDQRP